MTREHKLSLILGFAVVLVVGVLLSDHLSDARRVTLEQTNPADQVALDTPNPAPSRTPTLVLVDPQGRPIEPAPNQPAPVSSPLSDQLADGRPAPASSAEEELLRTNLFRPVDQPAGQAGPIAALGQQIAGAVQGLINGEAPIPAAQLDQPPPTLKMTGRPPESALPAGGATRVWRAYTVRSGDSLWAIASRELGDGFRHKELADLNRDRIGPRGELRVGASLRIPADSLSTPNTPTTPTTPTASTPPSGVAAGKPTPAKAKPSSKTVSTYTVKAGDTLGEIAYATLGTSKRYRELLEANLDQLDDADSVRAGMILKIPAR